MPNENPTPQAAPETANGTPPSSPGVAPGVASEAAPPQEPTARELSEFAKHRVGLREKARRLDERAAQLKAERAAVEAQKESIAALQKELAELKAWRETREKGNPLEHVEDPSKVVRDFVEKTAPERRIDALEKELKAAREELEKVPRLFKERDEREAQERAKQEEAMRGQRMAHERATFTRTLRSRAAEFPFIHSEFEDVEIETMAAEIQQWARTSKWTDNEGRARVGRVVSFEDAAKFLNERAKLVYESREARRKALNGESKETPPGTEHRDKKTPPGNGPRAQRPAQPPTRRDQKLTRAEEEERHLQMIRDAQARDRLDREKQNGATRKP